MIATRLASGRISFLIFSLTVLGVFLFIGQAQAATSTLRGQAWWGDTYEYVYFNCLDDQIGELLDIEGNFTDGFEFNSLPCTDLVHAVEIDENSNFSGAAWNETKGLINFSGAAHPPEDGYDFNVNCPNTCNNLNSCWACYNRTTSQVYGWARVAATGEWLKLNSSLPYPVQLQSSDSDILPGHDILPGDFIGTATSTLGNLDFNCESEGVNICNTLRDYKVYIGNLQAANLSAPHWSETAACSSVARQAVLRWEIDSGLQHDFEVVVNSSNELNTTTAACWSGKKTSSAHQYTIPDASDNFCTGTADLAYGEDYYWWVRLYDQDGLPTEWYKYNTNTTTDTDANIDGNAETFTLYSHEFPDIDFGWLPAGDVLVGTSTLFNGDISQYYSDDSRDIPLACDSTNCLYNWWTSDANAVISSTTNVTTTINFFAATNTSVYLQVSDLSDYTCTYEQILNSNYGLPIWREIKAE